MKEEIFTMPSNFKRGKLIVGSYRISDLAILGSGLIIAVFGFLISIFTLKGIAMAIGIVLFMSIGFLSWFLTIPFPAYHNMLGWMMEMYDFLLSQKMYPFEGVIYYDEEKDESERKTKYRWEEKDI